jgi:hypothetical protein
MISVFLSDGVVGGWLGWVPYPKADFLNGRFPENLGQHYDNSAQNFRENIHSGNRLSENRTVTGWVRVAWFIFNFF